MKVEDFNKMEIYVDFGGGHKFLVTPESFDEKANKLILKGSEGQLGWVKVDAIHPVKTFKPKKKRANRNTNVKKVEPTIV